MAHMRRNGKLRSWRSKRANHGKLGARGTEKGKFKRYRCRKEKRWTVSATR